MKIVLASQSAVKVDACKAVLKNFYDEVELITVKAKSNVAEQPFNEETFIGARNRIQDAQNQAPGADYYISIENGIFDEQNLFIDRAVTLIRDIKGNEITGISDGVLYPKDAVEEARKRGFDEWTVGKVMAEMGIVKQHDDPHLDLSGKSRIAYLEDALTNAFIKLQKIQP